MTREELESGVEFVVPREGDHYKYRLDYLINIQCGSIYKNWKIKEDDDWIRVGSIELNHDSVLIYTYFMGDYVEKEFKYEELKKWS